MKLMAMSVFFYKDIKRGKMQHVRSGDFFELDVSIEGNQNQVSELVMNRRCVVVDETIPTKAKYKVIAPFSHEGVDCVTSQVVGEVITLNKDDAMCLMAERKVIPVDSKQWHPFKENLISNAVRKMYD